MSRGGRGRRGAAWRLLAAALIPALAAALATWGDLRAFRGEPGPLAWAGTVAPAPGSGGAEWRLELVLPRWAEPPPPPGAVRMRAILEFELAGRRDFARWAGRKVFVVGICGRLEPGRPRPLRVIFAVPID